MSFFQRDIVPKKKLLVSIEMKKESYDLRFAVLKKSASVEDAEFKDAETIDTISELDKHLPVTIHVSGFGVLTRQVENAPNYQDNLIVSGDKSDFYFSSYTEEDKIAVSFIRKNLLEQILETINKKRAFVFDLFVGPIPLFNLKESYKKISADYLIEFKNDLISNLERNASFSENRSEKFYLESFLTGFESTDEFSQAMPIETASTAKKEFKEYRRFVNLGLGTLAFFLVVLTANYFYVNYLNRKSAELEADIYSYQENLSLIDRLEQEKLRKLNLVENSGIQTDNFISFYLDEIGGCVPHNIQFQNMEVFPLGEPLKPKRRVEPIVSNIVLKGSCGNSKILDDWMEDLEMKGWITSVELMNYVRLSAKKSNFHLLIKLST